MKCLWNEKREWVILAGILMIAVSLRFFRLGHQSFWVDELMTIGSYSSPPDGVSYWKKLLWDIHGPLYSLIMHFWSMVNASEYWLRIPGAISGVLSVFFMHKWLKMIASDETALTGALILALNPMNLYYSQELRFYSLLTLFIILSMIAFKRFTGEPGKKTGVILGLTLGLACLSHFMALFLCTGFFVYMALTRKLKGDHLRYGLIAAAITLAVVSPWIYREIYFLGQIQIVDISTLPDESRLRGELTLNRWAYPYSVYVFSVGYSFGPDLRTLHMTSSGKWLLRNYGVSIVTVLLLFGSVALTGIIRSARKKVLSLFMSVALVTLGGVTAAAMFNIKVFNIRYLMSAFPVFIALLAFGIPRRKALKTVVLSALSLIMIISAWNYHVNPVYARDDFRSGADIVNSHEREGDLILVYGHQPAFRHYYNGINEVVDYTPEVDGVEYTSEILSGYLNKYERVWYLQCRQWGIDMDEVIFNILSTQDVDIESWEFPGIRLFLCNSKPGARI